jgi:pimeloyl-ACP methyl ester carboxylesterase
LATFLPIAERLGRKLLNKRGWQSRYYETPLGKLHSYDARGDGRLPTVVIIHGLGSNGLAFARMMGRLKPYVQRVIALELPGHGFSDEPREEVTPPRVFEAAACALEKLDEPFVLVGNSLGGFVSMRYAIDRSERVRALALLSPAGARGTEEELDEVLKAFDAKNPREALALLRRIYHKPPWFLPLISLEFPDVLGRKAIREIVASAEVDHAPMPDELQKLVMPLVLVWGQSERLLPSAALTYFKTHLPKHAKILEPHSVGHCPHFDDPRRMADLVLDLAREV